MVSHWPAKPKRPASSGAVRVDLTFEIPQTRDRLGPIRAISAFSIRGAPMQITGGGAGGGVGPERRGSLPPFEPSPPVDRIAVEERAAALAKRSIKKSAKLAGLHQVITMMDLTTLE